MDWTIVGATAVGGVATVAATSVYNHLFSTRRVTATDCDRRHAEDSIKCQVCRKDVDQKICSSNHDISAIKALLILIAMEMKIPGDKLQELVK